MKNENTASQPNFECGACHGSGWVIRDEGIGTEQECLSCGGSGEDEEAALIAMAKAHQPKVASIGEDAQLRSVVREMVRLLEAKEWPISIISEDPDAQALEVEIACLISALADSRTAQHQPPVVQADSAPYGFKGCTLPPPGWYCTREPGHEGPCAAWPLDELAGIDGGCTAGQWVRCTPDLVNAGVSCAHTPRRPGDGTYSHDHFIAHTDSVAVESWKHAANEWADTAYNGLQWLKNIEDGITTDVKAARENLESCCKHSQEVFNAAHAADKPCVATWEQRIAGDKDYTERTAMLDEIAEYRALAVSASADGSVGA